MSCTYRLLLKLLQLLLLLYLLGELYVPVAAEVAAAVVVGLFALGELYQLLLDVSCTYRLLLKLLQLLLLYLLYELYIPVAVGVAAAAAVAVFAV